jgi:RNA 2',3'-cyclic 3'-phosphodiesterase
MSVFRAFIAVDLSADVLDRLSQVMVGLREEIGDGAVRWIPVENMHLTLKFLGDVSLSNVDRLKEIIQTSAAGCPMFAVSVGGVGAFPSLLRARVVWAGVEGPPDLVTVQRMIDVETARLGYASENRPFKPHLTLGRVSRNVGPKELQKIAQVLKDKKVGFLGVTQVKEVHLFRSDLQSNGAMYTRICSATLAEKK